MASALAVSASYDKQIRLWDAASGRTVKSFVFQDSQINSLLLLPDTGYLAVAGFGALRLYDLGAFLHSGNTAAGSTGGGGGGSANQAPPVQASFESQSSMNFTSLAAVPLLRSGAGDDQSSTLSGSSRQLTDSASSAMLHEQLLGTVVITDIAALLGSSPFRDVASLLIATSEDGHIRFFDANSAVTLRVLKDIATGAAITCSAVSPDRRYLLTGSQMGQVSMWHLPSIVASVALEMKSHAAAHKAGTGVRAGAAGAAAAAAAAAASRVSDGSPVTAGGGAAAKVGESHTSRAAAATEEELAKAFGRTPLQDINFPNDYSAIRSIAIEPLGRWAAVATNAGKVHFIRLARNASVLGSKSSHSTADRAVQGSAAAAGDDGELTPRGRQEQPPTSLSGSPLPTPQKSGTSAPTSSRLALTSGTGGANAGDTAAPTGSGYHGPREAIYRSALVVNELSSNARRTSETSAEGSSGAGGELANTRRGANNSSGSQSHPNSMGAVLLDHLEQQQSLHNTNSPSHHPSVGRLAGGNAEAHAPLAQQSAAARLAESLEMELFDTLQAHYKYILRVLISPNTELLVTCSADYSVGRFLVPAALRMTSLAASTSTDATTGRKSAPPPPPTTTTTTVATTAAAVAAAAVAAAARLGDTRNDGGSVDDAEVRNDTFSPSLASTQIPPTRMGSHLGSTIDPPLQQQQSQPQQPQQQPQRREGLPNEPGSQDAAADATPQPSMIFQPLKPLAGHNRWVWDGVFSDCSSFLFTASSDNTLRMWNGLTTERPQSVGFVGHTKPVVAVLLCYDKRRFGSVGGVASV